jgi:glycosyltransferase involved in cell wall biosynthesis
MVSAIIIFLNEERFLQEAIESVFCQTYDDWELLLVDDGSTDHSTEIGQQYAENHPGKVRYLEHEEHHNRGMSASRNLGVREAKGKYIAYLDADDIWLPNKLETQLAVLQSQPEAVMVYGPVQFWHSWTGNPKDQRRDFLYGLKSYGVRLEPDRLIEPPQLPILCLRFESLIPVPSSIMVERKVIESVGGSEEAFWGSLEDAVVYTKIGLRYKVFVSGACWTKYRRHPTSCGETAIKSGKVEGIRLSFIKWVEGYLADQKVTDPRVWEAVEAALRPYRHPRLFRLCSGYRVLMNRLEGLTIHYGRMILPISVRRWLWAKQEALRYRSLNAGN